MLTGKYRQGEKGRLEGLGGRVFQPEDSPQRSAILDAVLEAARELGVSPGEVAIAWVAAKGSLPIIGPRSLAQLENNLAAAKLRLPDELIARLDAVSALPPVFPYTIIDSEAARQRISGGKYALLDLPAEPVA